VPAFSFQAFSSAIHSFMNLSGVIFSTVGKPCIAETGVSCAPVSNIPAALLSEPCPCDRCPHAPRCAAQRLACSAFAKFNNMLRWQEAPRTDATRERFDRIFGEP